MKLLPDKRPGEDLIKLDVPEWDEEIYVKNSPFELLTLYDVLEDFASDNKGTSVKAACKIIVRTIHDKAGKRLLADGDWERMGEHSPMLVMRVANAIVPLLPMPQKEVTEAKKNSEEIPSNDSSIVTAAAVASLDQTNSPEQSVDPN